MQHGDLRTLRQTRLCPVLGSWGSTGLPICILKPPNQHHRFLPPSIKISEHVKLSIPFALSFSFALGITCCLAVYIIHPVLSCVHHGRQEPSLPLSLLITTSSCELRISTCKRIKRDNTDSSAHYLSVLVTTTPVMVEALRA